MPGTWKRIAACDDIIDGWGKNFDLPNDPGETGILVRWEGRLLAYKNLCPHQAYALDFPAGNGQIFTDDKTQLECPVHTAFFDPSSGECTKGPCRGQSLESLAIKIVGDDIFLVVDDDTQVQ